MKEPVARLISMGPCLRLDLMMPVLDGWTFCKIRQGVQSLMDIPVIAVSAGSMAGSRAPLRVDAMLAKPFDPDELAWLTIQISGRRTSVRRRPADDYPT